MAEAFCCYCCCYLLTLTQTAYVLSRKKMGEGQRCEMEEHTLQATIIGEGAEGGGWLSIGPSL